MKINSKWGRDMDIRYLPIEQLESIVIEDYSTTNPNTSIFKICVNYRDDVPVWPLMEYYGYGPYTVKLYRKFADIKKYMKQELQGLKKWYLSPKGIYGLLNTKKAWKNYYREEYSEEKICEKFYFRIVKYVEIEGEMIILYSADFSMQGKLIKIDDPMGEYAGFEEYAVSETEKVISAYIKNRALSSGKTANYRQGDILYIDGSPYEMPFYAVCYKGIGRGELLYINNAERLRIAEKYGISDFEGHYEGIRLLYRGLEELLPFYKIRVVNSCPYNCLTKASIFLKENPCWKGNLLTKIYPIFQDEFKNRLFRTKGESKMKEILAELTKVAKDYPEVSFTDYMSDFARRINMDFLPSLWNLTDTELSKLLSIYGQITTSDDVQIREKRYRELEEEYLQLGEPVQ